eukprot:gene14845-biopygen5382
MAAKRHGGKVAAKLGGKVRGGGKVAAWWQRSGGKVAAKWRQSGGKVEADQFSQSVAASKSVRQLLPASQFGSVQSVSFSFSFSQLLPANQFGS